MNRAARCHVCETLDLRPCRYSTHVREILRRGAWWRIPILPVLLVAALGALLFYGLAVICAGAAWLFYVPGGWVRFDGTVRELAVLLGVAVPVVIPGAKDTHRTAGSENAKAAGGITSPSATPLAEYAAIIVARWPGAIVTDALGCAPESAGRVLDVFMVPDERLVGFWRDAERLHEEFRQRGFDDVSMIPHSVSQTRACYPEYCGDATGGAT